MSDAMTAPTQHRLHWTFTEDAEHLRRWYGRLAYDHPPVCWLERLDTDCWMLVHLAGGRRIAERHADAAKLEAERVMFGGSA